MLCVGNTSSCLMLYDFYAWKIYVSGLSGFKKIKGFLWLFHNTVDIQIKVSANETDSAIKHTYMYVAYMHILEMKSLKCMTFRGIMSEVFLTVFDHCARHYIKVKTSI